VTINSGDEIDLDDGESISNDVEPIEKDDKDEISKWFERASSMFTEAKSVEFQSSITIDNKTDEFFCW